jgi:hypothetical protein
VKALEEKLPLMKLKEHKLKSENSLLIKNANRTSEIEFNARLDGDFSYFKA